MQTDIRALAAVGAVAALCLGASGEPRRLGVHGDPMGATVDDSEAYPEEIGNFLYPAWSPDDRDQPYMWKGGARDTAVARLSGPSDAVAEDTPAVEREFRIGRAPKPPRARSASACPSTT